MNRRDSIKAIGLTTLGTGALVSSCDNNTETKKAPEETSKKLAGVQEFEHERNLRLQEQKFFTDAELVTLTVLCDLIIPEDEFSGNASSAGVPDFIEFMAKDIPDYQLPLRGGLKWLDVKSLKLFGKTFSDSDEQQKIQLIERIAYPDKASLLDQQGVAFFSLVRNLTASGFFTSEAGVKDIGYLGNRPQPWEGVPEDILAQYGFTEED